MYRPYFKRDFAEKGGNIAVWAKFVLFLAGISHPFAFIANKEKTLP